MFIGLDKGCWVVVTLSTTPRLPLVITSRMMEPAVPTTLMDRAIIRITNGPDAILANCTRMMMEGGDTFRLLPGRRSSKSRMETEMRIPLFHRCCQLCLFCLRGFYNNNTVSHSATIAQTTLSAFRWSCCLLLSGYHFQELEFVDDDDHFII